MRRILHIVDHLAKNGTETFIMNLYRAIDRERYQFDFLTHTEEKTGFYDEIISLGGRIYSTPTRKQNVFKYHEELNKFFASHSKEYDTIHFHANSLTTLAPLFYAKKYHIPQRIVHVHSANCTGLHNKILHRLNRLRVSSLATHFLGCSCQACKWGYHHTQAYKKCSVITNGIDLNKFYPDVSTRNKTRELLGLKNSKIILHVGNFNPIKNHTFLLDTFAILLNRQPDAHLLCVGDGSLFQHTVAYAAELGIDKHVSFLGRREDIPDLMRAADLFVLPSTFEGLGIVLIEAQACGLKTLASTGVPKESKVNPSTTFLPLAAGPNEWAKEINRQLQAPNLPVSSHMFKYSIETTLNQIIPIYSFRNN